MARLLQCQQDAARFASGTARVDELRRLSTQAALRHLRGGDRLAALQAMYDGLARQAPLTFKPPAVTR